MTKGSKNHFLRLVRALNWSFRRIADVTETVHTERYFRIHGAQKANLCQYKIETHSIKEGQCYRNNEKRSRFFDTLALRFCWPWDVSDARNARLKFTVRKTRRRQTPRPTDGVLTAYPQLRLHQRQNSQVQVRFPFPLRVLVIQRPGTLLRQFLPTRLTT